MFIFNGLNLKVQDKNTTTLTLTKKCLKINFGKKI